MNIKRFSLQLSVFHGRLVPEDGVIVGYGAIIETYQLPVPIPEKLAFISTKKRQFETDEWRVYSPAISLQGRLLYHQIGTRHSL